MKSNTDTLGGRLKAVVVKADTHQLHGWLLDWFPLGFSEKIRQVLSWDVLDHDTDSMLVYRDYILRFRYEFCPHHRRRSQNSAAAMLKSSCMALVRQRRWQNDDRQKEEAVNVSQEFEEEYPTAKIVVKPRPHRSSGLSNPHQTWMEQRTLPDWGTRNKLCFFVLLHPLCSGLDHPWISLVTTFGTVSFIFICEWFLVSQVLESVRWLNWIQSFDRKLKDIWFIFYTRTITLFVFPTGLFMCLTSKLIAKTTFRTVRFIFT